MNLTWVLQRNKTTDNSSESNQKQAGAQNTKCQHFKEVLFGIVHTVLKKRSNWLRTGILLQILAYTIYYISIRSNDILYLYVRKMLGWDQLEFIILKIAMKSIGAINLLLILPYLKISNIPDSSLIIGSNLIQGIGYLIASFSAFSPVFLFVGYTLHTAHYPKYSLSRSFLRLDPNSTISNSSGCSASVWTAVRWGGSSPACPW